MVSAELIHNPYLLETVARFNGHAPKVNSAIEKFEGRPLVEWANEVPRTFRDEMNGLDFDLYFTGTDSDYKRIIGAFAEQGINVLDESSYASRLPANRSADKNYVRLTHKSSFESVDVKRHEVLDLLAWLDSHRNRWFEFDEFIGGNAESLDGLAPYIVINESPIQLDLPYVSVETVDSAREDLANTVLTNTPILFMVSPKSRAQFRNELLYVLNELHITQEQLFFYIHPTMNRNRAIRVISDLGVENPQVVDRPDDPIIMQYLDDYPSMAYIRKSIEIFRNIFREVSEILEQVGAESAVSNAEQGKEIAGIDSQIESFRNTRIAIQDTAPFGSRRRIADLCQDFQDRIFEWRNRKTGATGREQIWTAARDYTYYLQGYTGVLSADIITTMKGEQQRIYNTIHRLYNAAGAVPAFAPQVERPVFQDTVAFPNLTDALISQTGREKVSPKNDFFGLFGAGGGSGEEAETVEVASYDVWRFTAQGMLMPAIQGVVETYEQQLSDYCAALIKAYSQQLDTLIEDLLEDKELATDMLSDTERLFEEDKDWLSEFEDHLLVIERN